MDLFDFVEEQAHIFECVLEGHLPTNDDFLIHLFNDAYTLSDLTDELRGTFGTETPNAIVEAWINVAFMALQAAYQNGADRAKFGEAIQSIRAYGESK